MRAAGVTGNTMISLAATGGKVIHVDLDGNNQWPRTCCDAIVGVTGTNNVVDDVRIYNKPTTPPGKKATGVYFIGLGATGNVVSGSEIFNSFYGVIFRADLTAFKNDNTVDNTKIHDLNCDGVSFAGYGRVQNSELYRVGFDRENGPIPGGSFYTLNNPNGGVIHSNKIYDACGNNIDLVSSSNFTITDNTVENPGYTWGGSRPYCKGGFSVQLAGISNSTVTGNKITNSNRPHNRVSNNSNHHWFRASGAAAFADVPGGGDGVIAFILAADGANGLSVNNTIKNNTMQSFCNSGCLGIGYYATRNTGWDAAGNWKPSFYEANNPFGSQVGSRRCGGNWYAGNSTCSSGSPPPCNTDDYQHGGDQFRNDGCGKY